MKTPGTRHAVETAIDLRKQDKESSWEELAREMERRGVQALGDPCDERKCPGRDRSTGR